MLSGRNATVRMFGTVIRRFDRFHGEQEESKSRNEKKNCRDNRISETARSSHDDVVDEDEWSAHSRIRWINEYARKRMNVRIDVAMCWLTTFDRSFEMNELMGWTWAIFVVNMTLRWPWKKKYRVAFHLTSTLMKSKTNEARNWTKPKRRSWKQLRKIRRRRRKT